MRLLKRDQSLGFSLTRDIVSDDIPQYAILSHTWGPDTEEVTFKDLVEGTGKQKIGYNKIRFCAEQAERDGLQHFWVDTCCINKSNNTELQEAINSMFRWYRDATKCYVYLSDVSVSASDAEHKPTQSLWKPAFRRSKWFTRGWTLQELVAPAAVEFFSKEGVLLGSKRSLEESIHEITGVPLKVLRGCPLSEFSVAERMRWVEGRETTRKEDKAYSLLGIFGINMPLIYGEGEGNAFRRLREEINKASSPEPLPIPIANNAAFDSRAEEHNARCHPDTRVDLLHEIYTWVHDPDGKCIFWLNGVAGTGKSTISRTVAGYFKEQGVLGASFLFKRGERDRGNATLLFTTVAAQLARREPQMSPFVREALVADPALGTKALREQFEKLILQPLSQFYNGSQDSHTITMVIDALDECDRDDDIRLIIHLFSQMKTLSSVNLRVFITSRPELPIRLGFKDITGIYQDISLHQIPEPIIEHDITAYLRYELVRIRDDYNSLTSDDQQLPQNWPGERNIQILVQMSVPLFIFSATVCRFIGDETWLDPAGQLDQVINYRRSDSELDKLDSTYLPVLNQLVVGKTDQARIRLVNEFQNIVGPIVLLAEPLSAWSLSSLLGIPAVSITRTLSRLHAVLDVPIKKDSPIRPFHLSFRDFLTDPTKRGSNEFWVDEANTHHTLAKVCIQHLQSFLKEDMCHLKMPGKARADVQPDVVDRYLPAHIQYACRYWASHLKQSSEGIRDGDQVHEFLECHLLHWLEALSLMGAISETISTIITLQALVKPQNVKVSSFLYDSYRFVRNFISCVDIAPLQIYSAIIFTPEKSVIRRAFQVPEWIVGKTAITTEWGPCLQTIEGHGRGIMYMAFSPNGNILASIDRRERANTVKLGDSETEQCEGDNIITLWDVATGHYLQVLDHSSFVSSIAFSPDGTMVASAGGDVLSNHRGMIKIWDIATGHCHQVLDHGNFASVIAFSPDGTVLASAGGDIHYHRLAKPSSNHRAVIKIWNTRTWGCCRTLEGHKFRISSIAFSPNSSILASSESDNLVRLWNTATGHCYQTLEVFDTCVGFIFSPDGKIIAAFNASHFDDMTCIELWDTITGHCYHTLRPNNSFICSIAFSPDGRILASGSYDGYGLFPGYIKLWDIATGRCYKILEGSFGDVACLAFSPNGNIIASGNGRGDDRRSTIKLWDINTGCCFQILKGHNTCVTSTIFSPDGNVLASCNDDDHPRDGVIKLWDMGAGPNHQRVQARSGDTGFIVFSPDGSILASCNGFGCDNDGIIRLWDTSTGHCHQTLEGHDEFVEFIVFSPDSSVLASAGDDGDNVIKLWSVANGSCIQMLKCPNDRISSITFSPDGSILASGSLENGWKRRIKLWDVVTGCCLQTLECERSGNSFVAFSPNSRILASSHFFTHSDDGIIELWDVTTGKCHKTLKSHHSNLASITFSPDSRMLVLSDKGSSYGRDRGFVKLWDIATGHCCITFQGHRNNVGSVAFSPDGSVLASHDAGTDLGGNYKSTVYFWDVATGQSLKTTNVGRRLRHMSFDPSGEYLYTGVGTLHFHRPAPDLKLSEVLLESPREPMFADHWVSSDNIWIMWNSEKVLWLPPDYRFTTVGKSAVAIACAEGQVLILRVQPELLPVDE